ncbi:MAG: hypothetical protein AABX38_04030 [Candidatus Micrarchaeota archaeon]
MVNETPVGKSETRSERFKRVAEKRTRKILNEIRILSNCSNRSVYEYTEDDLNKIFGAIDEAVKQAKSKFSGDKKIEFKL